MVLVAVVIYDCSNWSFSSQLFCCCLLSPNGKAQSKSIRFDWSIVRARSIRAIESTAPIAKSILMVVVQGPMINTQQPPPPQHSLQFPGIFLPFSMRATTTKGAEYCVVCLLNCPVCGQLMIQFVVFDVTLETNKHWQRGARAKLNLVQPQPSANGSSNPFNSPLTWIGWFPCSSAHTVPTALFPVFVCLYRLSSRALDVVASWHFG